MRVCFAQKRDNEQLVLYHVSFHGNMEPCGKQLSACSSSISSNMFATSFLNQLLSVRESWGRPHCLSSDTLIAYLLAFVDVFRFGLVRILAAITES